MIAGGSLAGVSLGSTAHAAGSAVETLFTQAQTAEADRRDDRAATLYLQAHRADPFDPAPLNALGRLAVRIGATDEAVAYFEAALAIDRGDRVARRGLADALVELDRTDDALALYDILLAEDARDGLAWNGMGMALDLDGRHDEAQAAYRAGLAVAPDNPDLRANLGLSEALAAAPSEPAAARDDVAVALIEPAAAIPDEQSARSVSAAREP